MYIGITVADLEVRKRRFFVNGMRSTLKKFAEPHPFLVITNENYHSTVHATLWATCHVDLGKYSFVMKERLTTANVKTSSMSDYSLVPCHTKK